MWLTELATWLEFDAMNQPNDIQTVYLDRSKEIKKFVDKDVIK